MTTMTKKRLLATQRELGTQDISALEMLGYRVERLTEYHYRVDSRLDLFPTNARYHDIRSGERGNWGDVESLVALVRRFITAQADTPRGNERTD